MSFFISIFYELVLIVGCFKVRNDCDIDALPIGETFSNLNITEAKRQIKSIIFKPNYLDEIDRTRNVHSLRAKVHHVIKKYQGKVVMWADFFKSVE
jgi:hypothetical protein